ncbi:hypothetical protein B0G93_13122 [Bacillus sp. V-88]|nr:hypothetical protein B1B00_19800 [Bacillus sp. DSM 27956]PRX67213.1 hypothetical protein B0G93_13122 [Bacillus sp. V-88]SLK24786.1 hypothetical protein SAMN06295884_13122 [Bacillus sp. V-88]
MDKQIVNMLSDIQQNIKELDSNIKELDSNIKELDSNMKEFDGKLKEFGNDLKEVKETVNRIETSQTEDVIALLKVGNQRSETDFHYLNTRITNIDKRVFTLENRAER